MSKVSSKTNNEISRATVEYMTEEKYERSTLDKYKREQKDGTSDFDVKLTKADLQKNDKMEEKQDVHRFVKGLIDKHLDDVEKKTQKKLREKNFKKEQKTLAL